MTLNLSKTVSVLLFGGLVLTGCENQDPATTGTIAGVSAGVLAGGLAAAAGVNPGQAAAIGVASGAAVGVIAYVVAKHAATERQRRYAEERARLAYERMATTRKARVRKTRYIAVATVREKDSKGAKSVMVYDTQAQRVVGTNVYDVKNTPKDGQVTKYDTYQAEYVGS